MRILRMSNFVSPRSGGIRTALRHWGEDYVRAGHEPALIIPGPGPFRTEETQGVVFRVPAEPIPNGAGYSLIWDRRRLADLIETLQPDRLEVHDRATMRWVGPWAQRHGLPSLMFSHENMTGILQRRLHLNNSLATVTANFINGKTANDFDIIAGPSLYATSEWRRMGVDARVIDLGVDLVSFVPPARETGLAPEGGAKVPGRLNLVHCGRLSPEKNPGLSIEATRYLVRQGHDVHLTVLGHGPMRDELMETARDLPVTFHAYITGRAELAAVLGAADLAFAPGPVETFGLAALEALACGVPVVCPDEGALQEVVGQAGIAAPSTGRDFGEAALALLQRDGRRAAARAQAERFNWPESARQMLALHDEIGARGRARETA